MDGPSYIRLFRVASGGMGSVDLGIRRDGAFTRLVAIKRPKQGEDDDERALKDFMEEAAIAGLIRHSNVVDTYDFGNDTSGPFLIMEYVEGGSLLQLLKYLKAADERLPLQHALKVLRDVATGLHAAHELRSLTGEHLGLVHRDVSPGNVMLGRDGVAKIGDFGIAKVWGEGTKTETGLLKGKVGYLSPEQLRFGVPDRRADIYSLGVVLYEMLITRRLFEGLDFRETARRTLEDPPPDVGEHRTDAPPTLVQLCAQMLAKDPASRPQTAREVAERADEIRFSLIEQEGEEGFGDYVLEFFGDEIDQRRQKIGKLLSGAVTKLGVQNVQDAPDHAIAPATQATGATVLDLDQLLHAKTRRRRLMLASAAALTLSGAVVLWLSASTPPTSSDSGEQLAVPSPVPEPVAKAPSEPPQPVPITPKERPDDSPETALGVPEAPQDAGLVNPAVNPVVNANESANEARPRKKKRRPKRRTFKRHPDANKKRDKPADFMGW